MMHRILTTSLMGISLLILTTSNLVSTQNAQATTYGRRNPTDVILPDWQGRWNCNLDGRNAVLELRLGDLVRDNGDGTQSIVHGVKIVGRIRDNGGAWVPVEQRNFTPSDLASSRRDHMLPLRYNNQDNWMLMMHTWNRRYASGYTTWNGIPFGFQCQKS